MDSHSKIIEFKLFVKNNPFLISYIKNGKKSWQDMYELYDLYGEDEDAWLKFLEDDKKEETTSNKNSGYLDDVYKMIKNIDVDKVQEGITSLQKTLGLFGELFAGKGNTTANKEYNPRPLYRRFED